MHTSIYLEYCQALIWPGLFRLFPLAYFANYHSLISIIHSHKLGSLLFIINFYSIGLISVIIEYAVLYSIISDLVICKYRSSKLTHARRSCSSSGLLPRGPVLAGGADADKCLHAEGLYHLVHSLL